MVDPGLVLFAIQAGVKLGRKTYDVLVDSTQAVPLTLPVGTLAGSIQEAQAIEFFDRKEHRLLLEVGGPYHEFKGARLVAAYHTVGRVTTRLGDEAGGRGETVATLQALHQFEQHKAGFGPHSPWQRIAGTIVEIGIDYFVANPQAMGKDSAARRTVEAFLLGINDVDFAEGDPLDVVGDTLLAGLKVFGDNATLVSNDTRIHVLLGGVTASLAADLRVAGSLGQLQRREALFKRITASILRGGAAAVAGNADLFIHGDGKAKAIVRSTVAEMLAGIRDREELFSTETLAGLFRTALTAAAANAEFFADKKLVQEVLRSTVTALTAAPGGALFSAAAVEGIVGAALKTVGDHAGTLVDPAHPERQLVADAVAAIGHGLASELAGGAPIKQLLSTSQVVDLAQSVLLLVARHPERLVGGDGGDPRRTVIAQVLGSVASALAKDRSRLVNGDTFVELGRTALAVALKNRDKLLAMDSADPRTNLLYKTLDALAGAVVAGGDGRRLVDRDVFLETARRVLPVVSADVGPVLQSEGRVVGDAVGTALQLSTGTLENQINGDNVPALIGGLLRAALAGDVALNDAVATTRAAAAILRAAA